MLTKNRIIPLASADISYEDIEAVVEVLRSKHLSLGPKLAAFEEQFAHYVGSRYAIAINSGTSALHLAVRALGIYEGDEVITTPFSFVASSNCILFERATPVFADVLPDTGCIDPEKIKAVITPKTKAILAVDIFGYLADWDALRTIAQKHDITLIEDSCEALGSNKNGKQAGSFGDIGVFGFYPNKQITTGEGGMFVTDNKEYADLARSVSNQGRSDMSFISHERLGYNYRLSDINCALGISQLKRLAKMTEQKNRIMTWYQEALQPLQDYFLLPTSQEGVDVSYYVFVIRLREKFTSEDREKIMAYLLGHGIGCRNYFPVIHLQPFYREQFGYKEGALPIAEHIAGRTIALPFFTTMTKNDVIHVCATLKEACHLLFPSYVS